MKNVIGITLLIAVIASASIFTHPAKATAGEMDKVTLRVGGVECRSCVKHLRTALLKTPGVKSCTVEQIGNAVKNFLGLGTPEWRAVVEYEKGVTQPEQLVQVVSAASTDQFTYRATILTDQ